MMTAGDKPGSQKRELMLTIIILNHPDLCMYLKTCLYAHLLASHLHLSLVKEAVACQHCPQAPPEITEPDSLCVVCTHHMRVEKCQEDRFHSDSFVSLTSSTSSIVSAISRLCMLHVKMNSSNSCSFLHYYFTPSHVTVCA